MFYMFYDIILFLWKYHCNLSIQVGMYAFCFILQMFNTGPVTISCALCCRCSGIIYIFHISWFICPWNTAIKNLSPHTDAFWGLCSRRLLKTLWQMKKLLMMSNFSFCPQCFLLDSIIIILFPEVFLHFCLKVFKVFCCRFIVCGKWLKG